MTGFIVPWAGILGHAGVIVPLALAAPLINPLTKLRAPKGKHSK